MKLTTLGGKPADFQFSVKGKELDGSEVEIEFTGIGRTTLDWQPLSLARLEKDANAYLEREELLEAEKAKAAEVDSDGDGELKPKKRKRLSIAHKDIEKNTQEGLKRAVEMIREVASGWGLEMDFSDENIKLLVISYPGVQSDLWQEYDQRIKGLRVKN